MTSGRHIEDGLVVDISSGAFQVLDNSTSLVAKISISVFLLAGFLRRFKGENGSIC